MSDPSREIERGKQAPEDDIGVSVGTLRQRTGQDWIHSSARLDGRSNLLLTFR